MNTTFLFIYLAILLLLSSALCSFQHTSPVDILLDLHLSISHFRAIINDTIFLFFILFYLFTFMAASALSCSMWDLSLWHVGSSLRHLGFSLVVVRGLQSTWAL